jgi:hypothetical protein
MNTAFSDLCIRSKPITSRHDLTMASHLLSCAITVDNIIGTLYARMPSHFQMAPKEVWARYPLHFALPGRPKGRNEDAVFLDSLIIQE